MDKYRAFREKHDNNAAAVAEIEAAKSAERVKKLIEEKHPEVPSEVLEKRIEKEVDFKMHSSERGKYVLPGQDW
jgi:hypothetical protein